MSAFGSACQAWRDRVARDPHLRNSSATGDFTSLPEYRAIVALGPGVLAELMAEIAAGEYLLNEAAFELGGLAFGDVVPDPDGFYGDLEVSDFLLRWWRGRAP